MLLEACGATARVAYSGRSGLEALEAFSPDLILVDLAMPEMDGYETARLMRSVAERGVKIVAVTAWPPAIIADRVKAAGFDDLVAKPFSVEDLRRLIED